MSFDLQRLPYFVNELEKISLSIDDAEAPPGVSLNPRISQAWKLRKQSSWTEIGPDTPDRAWKPKTKTAEPPPPKGWTSKEWDKHLQREGDKPLDAYVKEKKAYKLQGHMDVEGIPVSVENRKGSVRKGKDEDGKPWRTKMIHPYGYIDGTKGKDGEEVDAYVGPEKGAPNAFVVHQKDKDTGAYDEDKVMLRFKNKLKAKKAFLAHYNSPKFLGPIKTVTVDRLKELIASKKQLVKIAAEKKLTTMQRIRKVGPGLGGLVGAGIGAAMGRRRGKLLKGALMGLGTGATVGWTPDMAASAKEAIKGKA